MLTDDGMNPGDEYYDWVKQNEGITCKRCGMSGLIWGQYKYNRTWRLFNCFGNLHECESKAIKHAKRRIT